MKSICRICLNEIIDVNFVAPKTDELCQIKIQLSICVPEMVLDLVKDPVFCKFCVSALHSAYNFKNQCLQTEERILSFSRKILSSKSIDITDLLYDLQQSTRNGVCGDNGERDNARNSDSTVTTNMDLLLSDENLVNRHNLKTESNTGYTHSVTLPINATNKINNANNVIANDFNTADEFNSLLNDPLQIPPIQARMFKQEDENEDITIKEEDVALQEVELSSYEGFEEHLFADADSKQHTADVKNTNNKSAIVQASILGQTCFVKLAKLPGNDALRNSQNRGEDDNKDITIGEENRQKLDFNIPQKNQDPKKRFSCALCKYRTVYKKNLKAHIRTHTGEKPYACNVCTYTTTTRSSLQEHLRIHTGEKPFACSVCTYRSARKASLQDHLRIHTGEKPFACNVCTYRFARKSNLQKHLQVHTGKKPYACNVCTYSSTTRSNLQEHLRNHTGEKPFACNVCKYRYARKSSLQKHLQLHTGEKPFACSVCTYRSAQKSCLQKHLRIHTGEKPFACNVCTYRSATRSGLQDHIRIHTGEKPFACNLCTYRSAQKTHLRVHLRSHTGVKPFACNLCSYRSARKTQLQAHLRIHDGE